MWENLLQNPVPNPLPSLRNSEYIALFGSTYPLKICKAECWKSGVSYLPLHNIQMLDGMKKKSTSAFKVHQARTIIIKTWQKLVFFLHVQLTFTPQDFFGARSLLARTLIPVWGALHAVLMTSGFLFMPLRREKMPSWTLSAFMQYSASFFYIHN